MTEPDVIQQARAARESLRNEALGHLAPQIEALEALVDLIDAGHLIDTRRMARVSSLDKTACNPSWRYTDWEMARAYTGATAADALAAAEREA